jgi:hypothetical protein
MALGGGNGGINMSEDLIGLSDGELEKLSKQWETEKKYYDALKSKAEAEAAANPSEIEKAKTLLNMKRQLLKRKNYFKS